jgi:hypothetical protein
MGRPISPKKVHRYSTEFKLAAVNSSSMTVVGAPETAQQA